MLENNCKEERCNHIRDTVARIDRLQKNVVNTTNNCITCEASLLSTTNNTIPITFTTCCGNRICGVIDLTGTTSCFYRIESVRCERFVTVRLLDAEGETLVATPFTMIIDLDCVGGVQCFQAINIEPCVTCGE